VRLLYLKLFLFALLCTGFISMADSKEFFGDEAVEEVQKAIS